MIHSTSGNPAATIDYSGGTVRFDGMTFTSDHPSDNGGAIDAQLSRTAQLHFDHCAITGSSAGGSGGGAYIHLGESSGFEIWDCEISNNLSLSPTGVAGGGLYLLMNGGSTTGKITWSTIENNDLQTSGSSNATGGAIRLEMYGGQLEMSDCLFSNNTLGTANGDREGSESFFNLNGDSIDPGIVDMRRNRFHSSSTIGGSDMVHVFTNGDVETTITDSWFSGGAGTGIFAEYYNAGTLIINNITATDFNGTAIWVDTDGNEELVSLTNSIVWNSSLDWVLPVGTAISGNVVGVNPLFVDPAAKNFRLQVGSPAIDTSSGTPIGGFSETDLHGLSRLIGSAVDAGGSEWGGLFGDGFEVGTDRIWTAGQ